MDFLKNPFVCLFVCRIQVRRSRPTLESECCHVIMVNRRYGYFDQRFAMQINPNAGPLRPVLWVISDPVSPDPVHDRFVGYVRKIHLCRDDPSSLRSQLTQVFLQDRECLSGLPFDVQRRVDSCGDGPHQVFVCCRCGSTDILPSDTGDHNVPAGKRFIHLDNLGSEYTKLTGGPRP